jgi:hypothetical protein
MEAREHTKEGDARSRRSGAFAVSFASPVEEAYSA